MKQLLLVLGVSFSIGQSLCQTAEIGDYSALFSENNVALSVAEGTFSESGKTHIRYFFKYENHTNEAVELSFQKELHYGDDCYGCNGEDEFTYSVKIPPNSTLVFDDDHKSKAFYIFVKDKEGWIQRQLTDFEIKNIKIVQL